MSAGDPRAAWNAVERLRALGIEDLAADLADVLRSPRVKEALRALDPGGLDAAEDAASAVGAGEYVVMSTDALQAILDLPCDMCQRRPQDVAKRRGVLDVEHHSGIGPTIPPGGRRRILPGVAREPHPRTDRK